MIILRDAGRGLGTRILHVFLPVPLLFLAGITWK